MINRTPGRVWPLVFVVLALLAGCGARQASPAAQPPATAAPHAAAALQPVATAVPPTATAVPPTATAVPPTATAVPPTATAVPPTATVAPPPKVMGPTKAARDPKLGVVRGRIIEGGVLSLVLFPEINGSFNLTVSELTPQTTTAADGTFEFVNVRPGLYLLNSKDPDGGWLFTGTTSKEDLIVKHVIMANGPAVYEVKAGKTLDLGDLPAALKVR